MAPGDSVPPAGQLCRKMFPRQRLPEVKDWEEIINYVNIQYEGFKTEKTMKQCREKVDNLKRRYKVEKRRTEFRGWSHVEWSLYEKLDEIMHSLKRKGNDTAILDCHSFKLMEPSFFEEAFETDRNKHHSFMNNRNGIHGSSNEHNNNRLELIASKDKGNGLLETMDGLCDVVLNVVGYENGVELLGPQNCKRRKASKGFGFDQSGANSQIPAPVEALADALVGFSEVYSRIEIAKMELFMKMNLELARDSGRGEERTAAVAFPTSVPFQFLQAMHLQI